MVLLVLSLIHCGIGRFCFCAFASFCFVRNDLWDYHRIISITITASAGFSARTGILTGVDDVLVVIPGDVRWSEVAGAEFEVRKAWSAVCLASECHVHGEGQTSEDFDYTSTLFIITCSSAGVSRSRTRW